MKERPILFSGAMVRAILEGRKTVTRRLVKPQPDFLGSMTDPTTPFKTLGAGLHGQIVCPYGQPGDRLWVREAHSIHQTHGQRREDGERWGPWGGLPTRISPDGTQIAYYREGFDRCDPGRWRPSIHMPRWASRILLEITAVRVERLQDISEEQARAEGIHHDHRMWFATDEGGPAFTWPQHAFEHLWRKINGAESWDSNPWVWVVEFKRVEASDV